MHDIDLVPPNLAQFGVERKIESPIADLITIWKTPYPVLTRYKLLCAKFDWAPFAGGTYQHQGDERKQGYITSGYRDVIINGRKNSPHLYALAIDVAVGDIIHQIEWAKAADMLFTRIGIYPQRGFVHIDLVSIAWINKFSDINKRYWIQLKDRNYQYFSKLDDMFAQIHRKVGDR